MTTTPTGTLTVHAIDPARLQRVRERGTDGYDNDLVAFAATGEGEPLRCCLRYAVAGETVALISHAPFDHPSVWTEVGPVYVHVATCDGPAATDRLPPPLMRGPRVLRTYDADDGMDYEHNTVVLEDVDLTPVASACCGTRASAPCTSGPSAPGASSTPSPGDACWLIVPRRRGRATRRR
ncbi:DUF1203 domain-containing protein [Jatrophihabitans sp. YIM 134969]